MAFLLRWLCAPAWEFHPLHAQWMSSQLLPGSWCSFQCSPPILSSSVWCFTNPSCSDLPEPAPSILKSTQAVRLLLSPHLHPHGPSFHSPTSFFFSPFSSPLFISDKVSLSCPGWPWIPEKKQLPCCSLLRGHPTLSSCLPLSRKLECSFSQISHS